MGIFVQLRIRKSIVSTSWMQFFSSNLIKNPLFMNETKAECQENVALRSLCAIITGIFEELFGCIGDS